MAELRWSFRSDGSPHQPVHTCTVTAWETGAGRQREAAGSGATKAAAKTAAAAALREQLRTCDDHEETV